MSLDIEHRRTGPARRARRALAGGPVIALRPARARDFDALRSLADRAGIVCEELELARLVRPDAGRLVLCATAVADQVGDLDPQASRRDLGAETVVGIGVIELDHATTMPSLVLVDPGAGDGLSRLIADALIEHARAA